MRFLLRVLCALATLAQIARADLADDLQGYLDGLAAEGKLSGAILIAKDGKPIASKAAGQANRETGEPNTLETKFNLGSVNKVFTAVAIAQLAQGGRLSFDDTVGKHLPDFPNQEVASKVTIHQLLTHTSGLGSFFSSPKFAAQREQLTSVAAHLPLIAEETLAFRPGEKFQYSNSGYTLLGAIIEKLSGQSYDDYVREHIFAPAGMNSTGFYEKGDNPGVAIGYTRMGSDGQQLAEEKPNSEMREVRGGPAGGGYSTVSDLVKFSSALGQNKLLDAEHTKLVMTGKVDAPGPIGKYAYGFSDKIFAGKHIVGHNGGAPGTGANLDMFPELGYTVAILLNSDPQALMPVLMKLREMIPSS